MIAETPVYADGTAAYDESIHWLYAPGSLTPVAANDADKLSCNLRFAGQYAD